MTFEDTKLLRHPTVKKAYQVMRGFFEDGDDFAKEAIRAAEILSTRAKNPDPDAIATCILMDGMIIPYKPEAFEQTVSVQAADYLRKFYSMDIKKPSYKTEGERQIILAQSIIGIENMSKDISDKKFARYRDMKGMLDLNEKHILSIASETAEQDLVTSAMEGLVAAKLALENLVRMTQEAFLFKKVCLPSHPTVKEAYELMRADEIKTDPLFTNRTEMGLGIAKVLLETHATSDPDVLGAALLNQYWEKKGSALTKKFSRRLVHLYRETSPFVSGAGKAVSEEAQLIEKASKVYLLEVMQRDYIDYVSKTKPDEIDPSRAARLLEDIEYYAERLKPLAAAEIHAGLKNRIETTLYAANGLINAPESLKIRKPGSPSLDWD